MTAITVSRILDPSTGDTIALEIVDDTGRSYFAAADPFWQGLRLGPFPCQSDGTLFPREEVARLEKDKLL